MGRIAVGLQGSGQVFDAIHAELAENLAFSEARPDLEFQISASLPRMSYRRNGDILIGDDRLRIETSDMRYELESLSNPARVDVAFDSRARFLARHAPLLSRLRNWNYLYRDQELAKNFMYDLFDWTTQLAQLEQGQSYIHASSLKRGDRGLAILGWGGVGKTTSLLKLVMEDGWKFLSDDLGIIDTAGNLYLAPKRLQVYGYNCEGQPRIAEQLLAGRSIGDRLNWSVRMALFGGKAVRRRIGAADLFGQDAICDTAPLTDIIYLERTSGDSYSIGELPSHEVARRMSAIVMAEMEPYPRLLREAAAAGLPDAPSIADIQDRTCEVLEQAFGGRRYVLIRTGRTADPDRLTSAIREIVG